jgi:hypothetical protein
MKRIALVALAAATALVAKRSFTPAQPAQIWAQVTDEI